MFRTQDKVSSRKNSGNMHDDNVEFDVEPR